MSERTVVVLGGPLAVCWRARNDAIEEAPKRLFDLTTANGLIEDLNLTISVDGATTWIVQGDDKVSVTVYKWGDTSTWNIRGDRMADLWDPPQPIPPNVWVRAVLEAHELVCTGPRRCGCEAARHELHESGLLLT